MVWEWLKKNKGTPAFKFVVFILVLFLIRISLLAFDLINNNGQDTEQSNENYRSEQVQSDSNNENEDESTSVFSCFDIHIGWSNIVVFVGLAAALVIIEKRKDKSSEKQKMLGTDNRKDE